MFIDFIVGLSMFIDFIVYSYSPHSTPSEIDLGCCWLFYRLGREIPISQNRPKGQNMASMCVYIYIYIYTHILVVYCSFIDLSALPQVQSRVSRARERSSEVVIMNIIIMIMIVIILIIVIIIITTLLALLSLS